MALNGSSFRFAYTDEIGSMITLLIRITKTSTTTPYPFATSCEVARTRTANGFRIKTRSSDDSYEFDLLIEANCTSSNCSGQGCDFCGNTHSSKTNASTTTTIKAVPRLTTATTRRTTVPGEKSRSTTSRKGRNTPSDSFTSIYSSSTPTTTRFSTIGHNYDDASTYDANVDFWTIGIVTWSLLGINVIMVAGNWMYKCRKKNKISPVAEMFNKMKNELQRLTDEVCSLRDHRYLPEGTTDTCTILTENTNMVMLETTTDAEQDMIMTSIQDIISIENTLCNNVTQMGKWIENLEEIATCEKEFYDVYTETKISSLKTKIEKRINVNERKSAKLTEILEDLRNETSKTNSETTLKTPDS